MGKVLLMIMGFKLCYVTCMSHSKSGMRVSVKSLMGNHPDFEDKESSCKSRAT